MTRYLLCRPHGGLNDVLCQIEKCWRHASSFDRVLIIDFFGNQFFEEFFGLLEIRAGSNQVVINPSSALLEEMNSGSVFPRNLAGRLTSYHPTVKPTRNRSELFDSETATRLSFDMSRDHSEDVLLHHSGGGGTLSFAAINRFVVPKTAASAITQVNSGLPDKFHAAHIRGTDLQTDYETFLRRLRNRPKALPLLLLTDSETVKNYARSIFPADQLLLTRAGASSNDSPIHRTVGLKGRKLAREEALLLLADLHAVTRAESFCYTSIIQKYPTSRPKFSGLSLLMGYLASSRNSTLFGDNPQRKKTRVIYIDSLSNKFRLLIFKALSPFRSRLRRLTRRRLASNPAFSPSRALN